MLEQINPKENFFVAERRRRLNALMSILTTAKAEGREVNLLKLKAEMGLGWGLSPNKVKEYLKLLEESGRIKIEGEVVVWI